MAFCRGAYDTMLLKRSVSVFLWFVIRELNRSILVPSRLPRYLIFCQHRPVFHGAIIDIVVLHLWTFLHAVSFRYEFVWREVDENWLLDHITHCCVDLRQKERQLVRVRIIGSCKHRSHTNTKVSRKKHVRCRILYISWLIYLFVLEKVDDLVDLIVIIVFVLWVWFAGNRILPASDVVEWVLTYPLLIALFDVHSLLLLFARIYLLDSTLKILWWFGSLERCTLISLYLLLYFVRFYDLNRLV